MLYADKQALETDLKVCLLAIRERELDFYTQNCRSIGTSAALLAGFAYAGLSSTSDFSEDTTEFSKGVFLTVTVCAMSLNIASMAAATWCSMLGPGLALRGPDGSMDRAVEGLALEYRVIFLLFAAGLLCFFFSALLLVIDEFEWVLSVVLALLLLANMTGIIQQCHSAEDSSPNNAIVFIVGLINLVLLGSAGTSGTRRQRKQLLKAAWSLFS